MRHQAEAWQAVQRGGHVLVAADVPTLLQSGDRISCMMTRASWLDPPIVVDCTAWHDGGH